MKKIATIIATIAMTMFLAIPAFAEPVQTENGSAPEIAVRIYNALMNGIALQSNNADNDHAFVTAYNGKKEYILLTHNIITDSQQSPFDVIFVSPDTGEYYVIGQKIYTGADGINYAQSFYRQANEYEMKSIVAKMSSNFGADVRNDVMIQRDNEFNIWNAEYSKIHKDDDKKKKEKDKDDGLDYEVLKWFTDADEAEAYMNGLIAGDPSHKYNMIMDPPKSGNYAVIRYK